MLRSWPELPGEIASECQTGSSARPGAATARRWPGSMRAALDGLGFLPELHTPGEDSAFMAGLLLSAETWGRGGLGHAGRFHRGGRRGPTFRRSMSRRTGRPRASARPCWPPRNRAARNSACTVSSRTKSPGGSTRAHGFEAIAFDDVGQNDERLPDVTYRWLAPAAEDVDWSRGAAWQNGHLIPVAEAKIAVNDWGVTRSDITYDVASVWEGGFFRLADHIDRFMAVHEGLPDGDRAGAGGHPPHLSRHGRAGRAAVCLCRLRRIARPAAGRGQPRSAPVRQPLLRLGRCPISMS